MSNLNKQVYIYSLSTDVFFNEEERKIKQLKDRYHDYKRLSKQEDEIKSKLSDLHNDVAEVNKKKISKNNKSKEIEIIKGKISTTQRQLDYYRWLSDEVFSGKKVSNAGLKRDLKSKICEFEGTRKLNPLRLNPSQTISLFESTLTRKLGMEVNKLSHKMIVIEVYNYEIFKNLLDNGFDYMSKHYVYWSSSSGQIRDKKAVFILEEAWDKDQGGIENSITAGLSIKDINANNGMSVNKFLAYKALASSASEEWQIDIKKCIVVDDVKVELSNRTVDFISRDTFKVERKDNMTIELEITDGAGMCLPSVSERLFGEGVYKNFQFRLPWMKGCLSPVPIYDFFDNPIVTDIYGKEWKLNDPDSPIEVIFFKSQFKMWKHFIDKDDPKESWKVYQDNFEKYKCEAAFMNAEEDVIPNAKTNYQYIQSLVDVNNEKLMELAQMTNYNLENMASDVDTMIKVLGCEDENEDKNEFQQAINLYPALLNDKNSREAIKNRKKKMLKEAKAGKLSIDGKYTYVLPDWYYVMNKIFLNEEKGLIEDGQVSCGLYDEGKVNLMRSPALSFEHVIRENKRTETMEKLFITKAVHLSPDGLDAKVLMADFDGDKILISPSTTLIEIVEDNALKLNVVPLEYEMGTSEPKQINSNNIYESLKIAFKANIGVISNTISKIFNKDNFNPDVDYNLIKKLCSYNNHIIDMAKTLDEVELPQDVKKDWNKYDKEKLPYFFTHAKDKKIVMERNKSTVNRLEDVIINNRLVFKNVVGKFDWKKLMWTPNIKDDAYIIDKETDEMIIKLYTELDRNKRHYMANVEEDIDDKKQFVYILIREKLLEIYPDPHKVADVLVRWLFHEKDSEYKRTLWESFGQEVVEAIRKNVYNEVDCVGCGETINKPRQRQVRCEKCQKEYRKYLDKERKRKTRKRLEDMSA